MTEPRTEPATRAIDRDRARAFLDERHIAVVGASPEKGNFGAAIARALRDHGTRVVTVHPAARPVDGIEAYDAVGSLPGDIDAVLVVVPEGAAAGVVREAAAKGIAGVWLFKGLGGPGSASAEAVAAAEEAGLEVVAGACPLMFLEPVGWFHRIHRSVRCRRGAITR